MYKEDREITLDGECLMDRESLYAALKPILPFAVDPNLDAIADALSEIAEEARLVVTRSALSTCVEENFAFRALRMLVWAAQENPNLWLTLHDECW